MGTRRHLKRELKEKAERDRLAAQKQQIFQLYFDEKVPIKQLAQRFRLKACTLYRWIAKLDKVAPDLSVVPTQPKRYKKIHKRAEDFIFQYLDEAKVPIQASSLREAIKSEVQLNLSKRMVSRYLKDELGLSYKKIKPINDAHNK